MQPSPYAEIRAARPDDEDAVVNICHKTFIDVPDFPYPELIGFRWVVCYIRHSYDFSFVAVNEEDQAVGYILCAPDSLLYAKSYHSEMIPLIRKACRRLAKTHPDLYKKHRSLFLPRVDEYKSFLLRRIVREYPAHLHIDLLPEYQKMGLGGKLMNSLLDRLKKAGITGIHIIVDAGNTNAVGYYKSFGFKILKYRKIFSMNDYVMGLKLEAGISN